MNLSDQELFALNSAFMENPINSAQSEKFAKVVAWAENLEPEDHVGLSLLDLALNGMLMPQWDDEFNDVLWSATERALDYFEEHENLI